MTRPTNQLYSSASWSPGSIGKLAVGLSQNFAPVRMTFKIAVDPAYVVGSRRGRQAAIIIQQCTS